MQLKSINFKAIIGVHCDTNLVH